LADGPALGLFAVRTVRSGDGFIYITGGQRIDKEFLQSLPLMEGLEISLYRSFDPPAARPEIASLMAEPARTLPKSRECFNDDTLTALPLTGIENAPLGVLLIGNSRADLKNLNSYVQRTALVVGLGGIFTGVLLSFWTASRVTRPVRELAASVREVSGGKWDARAPVSSNDEIGQLARDFNQMTEQLVDSRNRMMQAERVAAWRELARRLAHELKNPLFPLQITIENLQRSRKLPPQEFEEIFEEKRDHSAGGAGQFEENCRTFQRFCPHARAAARAGANQRTGSPRHDLFDAQFHMPDRPQITPKLQLDPVFPKSGGSGTNSTPAPLI